MKKEKKKEKNKEDFPVVRSGKFVCSDGAEYADGYYARMHEKEIAGCDNAVSSTSSLSIKTL